MAQPVAGVPGPPQKGESWLAGCGCFTLGGIALLVVLGLLGSSLTMGSCDFGGPRRDACAESSSRLVRASVTSDADGVRKQLRGGKEPNKPDGVGNRALPCAAMVGNLAAVRVLLDAGADPNLRGETGGRPIVAAVSGEGRQGNDVEPESKARFEPLDSPQRIAIVRLLAAHGAELETGLSAASEKGLVPAVKALLAAGADPSGAGLGPSPLLSAIFGNHGAVVGLLLATGADPNHGGLITRDDLEGALYLGLSGDQKALGALAGQVGKLPNSGTVQPLAAAALEQAGTVDGRPMLAALIDAGADVNALAFGHYSPLWVAVVVRNYDAALVLHQHGALNDPPNGKSASQVAYLRGDDRMMAILAS